MSLGVCIGGWEKPHPELTINAGSDDMYPACHPICSSIPAPEYTIDAGGDYVYPCQTRIHERQLSGDYGLEMDERPYCRLNNGALDKAITCLVNELDQERQNPSIVKPRSFKPTLPPLRQRSGSPRKGRPQSRSSSPQKRPNSPKKGSNSPKKCPSSPKKGFASSEMWLAADLSEVAYEHPNAMDADRVFVWRSNEWHPVSPSQDHQIKAHLSNGLQVFEISEGPFEWTIDTTPKDGWVQISKTTGKRRAMKCQQMTDSLSVRGSGPSIGVPTVSREFTSAFMPTPGGDDDYDEEAEDDLQLVTRFREEWDSLLKSVNDNAKGQNRSVTQLREEDLVSAWLASGGPAGQEYKDLMVQSIADAFLKIDLSRNQKIEEAEWLHYWLLENQAPSFHALVQVNEKLLLWLQHEPGVLSQLLDLFLRTADSREDAQMTAAQMRSAAQEWVRQDSEARCKAAPRGAIRCEIRKQSIDYLTEFLASKEVRDEDDMLTYYEYLNHMLGRRKVKVQLYQYDMSRGKARWMSPYLFGQQLEGIWHTSIVVHGKEYWYGGRIFESEIGSTPFGSPTKIVDLYDPTMLTADDFRAHLGHELAHIFTVDAYDILDCNCNHFSDAACRFLLNAHIPRDILMQPELIKESWALKILRPMLNRKLGQFHNVTETTGEGPGKAFDQINEKEDDDWHAIQKGTLVVWEHDEGWTRIARVMDKNVKKELFVVKWLDLHTGELNTRFKVKRSRVRKLVHCRKPWLENQEARLHHRRASDPMVGGTFGARYHMMGA